MSNYVTPMTKDEELIYAEINKFHRKLNKYKNWDLLKVKKTKSFKDFRSFGRFYIYNADTNTVHQSRIDIEDYLNMVEKEYNNMIIENYLHKK